MSNSTQYSGNPFISRRERQADVTIYNKKRAEADKQSVFVSKLLKGVKVDTSLANSFSTSGYNKDATCKMWVELRDGNAGYVNQSDWNELNASEWTVQPGKDYFVYNETKYVVQFVLERKNIKGGVDILEVVGK